MEKYNDLKPKTRSASSSCSSLVSTGLYVVPAIIPNPSTVLTVDAYGVGCGALSGSSQLSIPIYRGTSIDVQPEYVSERPKVSSNSAILRRTSGQGDAIATTYKMGFSGPKIGRLDGTGIGSRGSEKLEYELGDQILKVKTGWLSNSVTLIKESDRSELQWKYTKTEVQPAGKKKRVLALSTKDGQVFAVLLRMKGTRTPGSSRWGAGNGGQLFLDPVATTYLDEMLIIATCLMMLKREVDRTTQANSAAT